MEKISLRAISRHSPRASIISVWYSRQLSQLNSDITRTNQIVTIYDWFLLSFFGFSSNSKITLQGQKTIKVKHKSSTQCIYKNFLQKYVHTHDRPVASMYQQGGPKTRRGGHIFKIQYWMYAATGGPNMKWGAPISNGGTGRHCPPPLTTPRLTIIMI